MNFLGNYGLTGLTEGHQQMEFWEKQNAILSGDPDDLRVTQILQI